MSAGLPITKSRYWQSLQEADGSAASEKILPGEFPEGASEWLDPLGRRRFLKLMSASIALAGVGACTRQPLRAIVPYVRQPEELVPGRPLFFATALTLAGYARGVLVETHEGRPTKIEGNPEHPASRGASDIFMQAEILVLYDPDRSQAVIEDGQVSNWDSFLGYLARRAQEWRKQSWRWLAGIDAARNFSHFSRPNTAVVVEISRRSLARVRAGSDQHSKRNLPFRQSRNHFFDWG